MITIIIPVYNVIKYLDRCIESALNQTYKDIEIILVDDGSTDGSSELCDKYKEIDSRIKVIHKKNEGLSSARNMGLDNMTGKYVTFLDSDDYLSSDYVEKSLYMMEKYNADISIMRIKHIPEEINEELEDKKENKEIVYTSQEAIEISLYQTLFGCCAPGKLYKKEIFDKIKFPFGKISEDLAICHELLDKANDKIIFYDKIGYYYRQHNESITHNFNLGRLDGLEWTDKIEKFCASKYPKLLKAARCRTFNVAIHLLLEVPDSGSDRDKCIELIKSKVNQTRMIVIFNKNSRFRDRVAAVLSFFGERNLKKAWNSKFAIKQG